MSVALIAPGRALLVTPRNVALWAPVRGSGGGGGPGGAGTPGGIPNLSGWWDAGTLASLLDANGNPVIGWGSSVASLADKSGTGAPLTTYFGNPSGTSPNAAPRVSGLLGAVGRSTVTPPALPAAGMQLPALDPDQGLALAAAQMGSGQPWTRYLVWSRPNWRQGSGADGAAIALLTIGGTVILAADSAGGANRLVLFPGGGQTVLATTLTRRHTHAVVLRSAGAGVDVWLDGVQVAAAAPNPLPASVSARLLFLHDGTPNGAAQCWFHEAATWERALTAAEITILQTYAGRWAVGARKGVQLLIVGQSNAGNGLNDGAWHLLAQGLAWHLGALAYGVVGLYGSGTAYTCIGGHGIYDVRQPPNTGSVYLSGDFIHDPGDGSDPSGYALGADGVAVQAYLGQQAAADLADIAAIFWPWSETDSTRAYSEEAFFTDGAKNLLGRLRGMLGRSVASLPLIWWNAMPFWTDPGVQMHREVAASVAADATQNTVIGLPMTADVDPRSGDGSHIAVTDNIMLGRRAAPVVARAILAAGGKDTLTIPAGLPVVGGPKITHAYKQDALTVILTVQHDAGTDLDLPGTAPSGTGIIIMDGGSVAAPGTLRQATACARVDATHLQITLATPLVSATAACLLFYPYGSTRIGHGNAVTDNFSAVAKPAGWDIGGDLGSAWSLDYPLAATAAPIALSDSTI